MLLYCLIGYSLVISRVLLTDLELDDQKISANKSINKVQNSIIQETDLSSGDSSKNDVYAKKKTKKSKRSSRDSLKYEPGQPGGGRYAKPAMSIISERTESGISNLSYLNASQVQDEDKRRSSYFSNQN